MWQQVKPDGICNTRLGSARTCTKKVAYAQIHTQRYARRYTCMVHTCGPHTLTTHICLRTHTRRYIHRLAPYMHTYACIYMRNVALLPSACTVLSREELAISASCKQKVFKRKGWWECMTMPSYLPLQLKNSVEAHQLAICTHSEHLRQLELRVKR